MNIRQEKITVGVKVDKYKPGALRIGEAWINVASEEIYASLVKGNTYNVEIQTNDTGKQKIVKVLDEGAKAPEAPKKAFEKKAEVTSKAEFRNPNQIMRSSAIGVSLSFVAQALQNDLETKFEDKEKLAFDLAKKVEEYING